MPRRVAFRVSWSPERECYHVHAGDDRLTSEMLPRSAEWLTWLASVASFAYENGNGEHFTFRKEQGKRGGAYWYAYRRVAGRVRKRYLGRDSEITPERLSTLVEVVPTPVMPIETPRPASRLLLTTKLRVPRSPNRLVARPHIFHRLEYGLERPLTLITAPAGFGKTTALSVWADQVEQQIAWVALDADDNDEMQFWLYLLTALDTAHADIFKAPLSLLDAPQPPPITTIARLTLNAIATQHDEIVLVLDDYHHVTNPAIHRAIAQMLDHPPERFHLVLSTRTEPPLPLARMRAHDLVHVIRADDLRFRVDEVASFLSDVMALRLSPDDVLRLAERTDGWAAGLQIAALSLQDHPDPSRFVANFGGSHRHIMTYLGEEVLAAQSPEVQDFLTMSSLLDRFCASLCDAVTGRDDSQTVIERIEQANLFLVALDDEGNWYRYYHPFADLLRHRLREGDAARIPLLHRKATSWLEAHGYLLEAIYHALDASDDATAARLAERVASEMTMRGDSWSLLRLLDRLPEQALLTYPRLFIHQANACLHTGQLAMGSQHVESAAQGLAEMIAQDRGTAEDRATIAGEIAMGRATLAVMHSESAVGLQYAQTALATLPASAVSSRGAVLLPMGIAYMDLGDFPAADQSLAESIRQTLAVGSVAIASVALGMRAMLLRQLGRLHEAATLCRHIIQLSEAEGSGSPSLAASGYVGLGNVLYEWGDFVAARLAQEKGIALGQEWANMQDQVDGSIGLAFTYQAQGQVKAAQEAFAQAEAFFQELAQSQRVVPWLPPMIAGSGALLALRQGRLDVTERWAHDHALDLSAFDSQQSVAFSELNTLITARLAIARGRSLEAASTLKQLYTLAEVQGRRGTMVEIQVLHALALHAQGDLAAALDALRQALSLGVPEGYARVFLNEGPPMRALLAHLRDRLPKSDLLVAAIGRLLDGEDQSAPLARPVLIEPLSTREREVLRLLAQGQSNHEIARSLIVAVSTVKTHLHHLFAKLQATDRLQAVTRARALGLLE